MFRCIDQFQTFKTLSPAGVMGENLNGDISLRFMTSVYGNHMSVSIVVPHICLSKACGHD